MFLLNDYLDLVTSQHRTKPKYTAMLSEVFQMYVDLASAFEDINFRMNIETAVGDQLDKIGEYIGQTRKLDVELVGVSDELNDDDYRFLLKSKIAQNKWNGTIEQLYEIWEQMFPDISLVVYDNQDMTCSLLIVGTMSNVQIQLFNLNFLVPKPCGVKYNYIFVTRTLFGYNFDNEQVSGYNVGYWEGDYKLFAIDVDNVSSELFGGVDAGEWA